MPPPHQSDPAPAPRIASLLAAATEILYALGLGDHVVAISHECDFPPTCTLKPRVTRANVHPDAPGAAIDAEVRALLAAGTPLYIIDADRLAALRPDLIVTQAHCEVCAVSDRDVHAALHAHPNLRRTRVVSLDPTTLDAVMHDILRVGEATDRPAAARALINQLHARLNAVAARLSTTPQNQRPTVACIEWIQPLMVAANWMPDLIARAGGRPLLTASGQRSRETSWDDLRRADPDVLIVAPCGFDLRRTLHEARALAAHPTWRNLSAVRAGRVFAVDGNALFNRSGPRLVDSVELLAQLLHPDRFPARPLADPLSTSLNFDT